MKSIISLFIAASMLFAAVQGWAQDDENPPDLDGTPTKPAPPSPAPTPPPADTEAPPADTEAPAADAEAPPEAAVEAKGDIPTVVLGLGAGVYFPTSDLAVNFLVGIDGSYQLPWLDGKIGVGLGLAYSQPTTSGAVADDRVPGGTADYSSTMREVVLDLLFSYRFLGWDSSWSPHAALGPVFYFLSHKVDSLGVENTETSTQVGFIVNLGVDFRLGPGAVIGEARIPFATVDQRTTGASNVGAVSVVVGYRLRL
jgi:hypothetical protein